MYITGYQKVFHVGFNLGCAFLEWKAQTVNMWKKQNHIKTFMTEKRKRENDTEQNLVTAFRPAKRRVLVLAPLKHNLLHGAESFLRS